MAERAEIDWTKADASGKLVVEYTVQDSDKKVSVSGSYVAFHPGRPDLFLANFSAADSETQEKMIRTLNYGASMYARAASRQQANAQAEGPEKAVARATKLFEGLSAEAREMLLARLAAA